MSAERAGEEPLKTKYLFEEVCAKTLYNLSRQSAPGPFDPDAPFRVVPNAFDLGRRLNIDDSAIVRIIIA